MSIVATKAVPFEEMLGFVMGLQTPLRKFVQENFEKVWIVSITDPHIPSLFKNDRPNAISLKFHDSYPPNEKDEEWIKEYYKNNIVLFNEQDAKRIINFILKANSSFESSKDLLLVNCMMGIARSGAVVSFAKELFGLNSREFEAMNPQIRPNNFVLQTLETVFKTLNR